MWPPSASQRRVHRLGRPRHARFEALQWLADIALRSILLGNGDKAHSRYFSEDVYVQALNRKDLVVVPEARHIDVYDDASLIPFEKIATF